MESVYDPDGVDYLWTKLTINGGFLINGAVDVYGNMPATSYAISGPGVDLGNGLNQGFGPAPQANPVADAPPGLQGFPGIGRPPVINLSRIQGLNGVEDLSTNVDPQPVGSAIPNPVGINKPTSGIASGAPRYEYQVVPASNTANGTLWAIRHRLNTPRGGLYVFYNTGAINELLWAAPNPGMPCDANNGPHPVCTQITQSVGEQSLFCNFQIESCINECLGNANTAPALLSNRFKQREELTEDHGLVRTTEGRAIFRTDLVYTSINPDALRTWLFPPIPNGYKRTVQVEGMADCAGVTWACVDRQVDANFPVGPLAGATRIEVAHRQALQSAGSPLGGALSQLERFYNLKWLRSAANEHPVPKAPPKA